MTRTHKKTDNVMHSAQVRALDAIVEERKRQDEKWGIEEKHPLQWLSVIGEEYGETCAAYNDYTFDLQNEHIEKMIKEAIECAASCVAMIEDLQGKGHGKCLTSKS